MHAEGCEEVPGVQNGSSVQMSFPPSVFSELEGSFETLELL